MALVNTEAAGWGVLPDSAGGRPGSGKKDAPPFGREGLEGEAMMKGPPGPLKAAAAVAAAAAAAAAAAGGGAGGGRAQQPQALRWVCMDDETPIWLTDAQAMAVVSPQLCGADAAAPVLLPKPLRAATPYIIFYTR